MIPALPRLSLILPLISVAALAACTQSGGLMSGKREEQPPASQSASAASEAVVVATAAAAPIPRASAKTAAQFDTTTTAQKAAAAAPPASAEKKLGLTVASLGDPTQPGFWIKTPLVKSAGKGRIVNPANGKSAKVDLQPLAGPASSGSQVSLPALQLIGISLTDLPSVEVYQN